MLCVFVSLFLVSCGIQNNVVVSDTEYLGEGEKWKLIFEVKPLSYEEDYHRYIVDKQAKYLGEQTEIKDINSIRYEYLWIHQRAEYKNEEELDFRGGSYTDEPVVAAFGRGSAMRRKRDNKKEYSSLGRIKEDLTVFSDNLRVKLKWNEQEEIIDLRKK